MNEWMDEYSNEKIIFGIFSLMIMFSKVEVDCPSTGCKQVFLCQQWIADDEGDGRLERDLFESEDMRQKRKPSMFVSHNCCSNIEIVFVFS